MTDNEIIKALERMSAEDADGFSSDILDLIKRQQAKIEELSEILSDHIRMEYAKIRAEAITEFAERLKTAFKQMEYTADIKRKTVTLEELICQANWILREASIDVIDDLLIEMTEGNNGA